MMHLFIYRGHMQNEEVPNPIFFILLGWVTTAVTDFYGYFLIDFTMNMCLVPPQAKDMKERPSTPLHFYTQHVWMHAWHLVQLLNLLLTTFYQKLSCLYVWVSCVTTLVLTLMAIFHNFTLTNMSGSSLGQGNEEKTLLYCIPNMLGFMHGLINQFEELSNLQVQFFS